MQSSCRLLFGQALPPSPRSGVASGRDTCTLSHEWGTSSTLPRAHLTVGAPLRLVHERGHQVLGERVAGELRSLLREVAAQEEVLELDVLRAPRGAGDGLLRHEAGGGEHAQAAVRELLLLHDAELGGVLRLEAERVEAEVARGVALLERLHVVHLLVWVRPALL